MAPEPEHVPGWEAPAGSGGRSRGALLVVGVAAGVAVAAVVALGTGGGLVVEAPPPRSGGLAVAGDPTGDVAGDLAGDVARRPVPGLSAAPTPPVGWWTPISGAPLAPRTDHTFTWVDGEAVVVGGFGPTRTPDDPGLGGTLVEALADGAAYDPRSGRWRPLPRPPAALGARRGHTATWTGSELLVWGGRDRRGALPATGAAYDPAADAWRPLPPAPTGGRVGHSATWTGQELVVWGGERAPGAARPPADGAAPEGAAYDPATDRWRPLPPARVGPEASTALHGRTGHAAVWTGTELLVWGRRHDTARSTLTGAAYDPAAGRWRPLPPPPDPLELRSGMSATWTGEAVLVWGGMPGQPADHAERTGLGDVALADGGALDPRTGRWALLPTAPIGRRSGHAAVWTGSALLVWGGRDAAGAVRGDGAILDPAAGTWGAVPAPPVRGGDQPATWTGRALLVYGGQSPVVGLRFDPVVRRSG